MADAAGRFADSVRDRRDRQALLGYEHPECRPSRLKGVGAVLRSEFRVLHPEPGESLALGFGQRLRPANLLARSPIDRSGPASLDNYAYPPAEIRAR